MMRSSKSQGGLTHGRGMTETVRLTWLGTMNDFASIHSTMTVLTNTDRQTTEHVEVSAAHMKRDMRDLGKVTEYLQTYSPFQYKNNNQLVSLSSGVTACAGDGVN